VYFRGFALVSFHDWTGLPASLRNTMVALCRIGDWSPLACVIQFHKLDGSTIPRFNVTSPTVCTPLIFKTGPVSPDTSWNPPNGFDGPYCTLKLIW
jgi:hypothetical protein